MAVFKDFDLLPQIQKALDELEFTEPTEIQKKAIPLLLASEKIDFHGQAQTGTGKTLAFGIPLLQRIDLQHKAPQALVIAPTRELAIQIADSIKKVAHYFPVTIELIYGGVSLEEQVRMLKKGVQIIIGTPGRINDHLRRKTLNLDKIKTVVLDEADVMLEMGFKEEVDDILKFVGHKPEIWLFSATVKPGLTQLMANYMEDPVSVRVSKQQIGSQNTAQYFCIVPFRARLHALSRFIESIPDFYGFVFCQTKILTSDIAEQLIKRGYSVGALHGDMSQAQRNAVIKKFRQGTLTILVATDVAARGIDIPNLTHVINYSLPEDLESYVHRIGRTGRAGKKGIAITFIAKSELRSIHMLEKRFQVVIEPIDVPSREIIIQARLEKATEYLANLPDIQALLFGNQVQQLVNTLPEDKIRPTLAHLLYDKFLGTLDLEEVPFTHLDKDGAEEQLQELSLSVGTDDGLGREDIREFLMQTGAIQEEQIKSIRVLKRRSFVKLSSDCSPDLVQALRGQSLGGRKLHVNLTCVVAQGRFDRRPSSSQRRSRNPREQRRNYSRSGSRSR